MISVDFEQNTAIIQSVKDKTSTPLFSFLAAQQKLKKIRELLQNDSWTQYFNQDPKEIKQHIIHAFLNSTKSLQQIKQEFKN
jgi:hypothetical protein